MDFLDGKIPEGAKTTVVPSRPMKLDIISGPAPFAYDGPREKVFIAISGIIGAGKSTLAAALADLLGLPVYYEPVTDNDYLKDFYNDMAKYSFPLQIYLLNRRFAQHMQIVWSGGGGVSDRSIYEDGVFAQLLMESKLMERRDYDTYVQLFSSMSNFMKKPTLIVHLDVSPEEALERVKLRNRDCETGLTVEYLRKLAFGYEAFIDDIRRVIPVIRVKWEQRHQDVRVLAAQIKETWEGMQKPSRIE